MNGRELFDTWAKRIPWMNSLKDTPQDPEWHGEGDVETHTLMVLEKLNSMDPNRVTRLGALLHDVGKAKVTREREIDGVNRIISPGHAYEGFSHVAQRILDLDTDLSLDETRDILGLIRFHHHPKRLVNMDLPSRGMACRLDRVAGNEQLWKLEQADVQGRICADQEWQIEVIDLFRAYCQDWDLLDRRNGYGDFKAKVYDTVRDAKGRNDTTTSDELFDRCVADFELGEVFSLDEALAKNFWVVQNHPIVHICTGAPASGKSSFAHSVLLDGQTEYVSMDAIRDSFKKARRKYNEGHVLQQALEEYRTHLRAKKAVVWDSTNLTKDIRKRVIGIAQDYGAFVNLYGFSVRIENLISRNRSRGETVPESVLKDMVDRYQFPDYDEGDRTWIVDSCGIHHALSHALRQ